MQSDTLTKLFDILEIPESDRPGYIEELDMLLVKAALDVILHMTSPEKHGELVELLQTDPTDNNLQAITEWMQTQIPEESREMLQLKIAEAVRKALDIYFEAISQLATESQKSKITEIFKQTTL
jgi:hypothetical protein